MNANKILVVDDEAEIRRLLQEILSEEGFEVEVAANAEQARAARRQQLPDLTGFRRGHHVPEMLFQDQLGGQEHLGIVIDDENVGGFGLHRVS